MISARSEQTTHEVTNQPPPRPDGDLWRGDPVLRQVVPGVQDYAAALDTSEMREAARQAERFGPELVLFDAGGRRLDEVRYGAGYHALLRLGLRHGYAARPWEDGAAGHLEHAAMVYLATQIEPAHCCPMTMTYAAVPAVAAEPALACAWVPKLTARDHDPGIAPIAAKRAATMGMAMTEKQGGSDVRANATTAARDGAGWRLTGHKWFCSAPMSDGFLTLAQTPAGLSCFLVPRWLEGERNAIHLMRLKDKLGNRANASAEIEYHGAFAHLLGEEGRGIRTIIEMVHHTRLDTATAPAGLMRAGLSEALHWCAHRTTFQRRLIDQPLMRSVLADLTLDWAGAATLTFAVARAFDAEDRAFARVAVALAKFLNNKLCTVAVAECMEVLGGMGYVADTPLPMLYREAPLNGIWEGSGNVICLDILRTLSREPAAAEALEARLDGSRGDAAYDAALARHRARWPRLADEAEARWFCESLARLLTAAELMAAGSPVASAWCAAKLGPRGGVPGAVRVDTREVLDWVAGGTHPV